MGNPRTFTFKEKLLSREPLIGTWIKTPSRTVAEVLSCTDIDVLCLDAEHAPFDRDAIDAAIFPCRAAGKPVLVRTRSAAPTEILNALDCGATGVLLPHVRNRDEAGRAAAAAHFGPGGRGYAGSTRAAGFAKKRWKNICAIPLLLLP
jgi:staphyloferrin B biosynthesis citrate synthase